MKLNFDIPDTLRADVATLQGAMLSHAARKGRALTVNLKDLLPLLLSHACRTLTPEAACVALWGDTDAPRKIKR